MPGPQQQQILETADGAVRLERRLGSGSMGTVHQGWHEKLQRKVAVKFLTTHSATSHERFLREGQNAARVDHPHVVRLLGSGDDHGRAYLVLELVEGRSLGDLLDHQDTIDREHPPTDRPLGALPDLDLVARVAREVADGLVAIHAAGVVHRDIKPDNLLLAADGTAKISDLGLAKLVADQEKMRLTGTNMVVGTPLYVSPEGIRNPRHLTGAADVYSLGATLYHALTGRPPFPGSSPYDVMRGHLDKPVTPLRQTRPGIPLPLATVVERCLAKDPAERPTPQAIIAALAVQPAAAGRRPWLLIAGVLLAAAVAGWLLLR